MSNLVDKYIIPKLKLNTEQLSTTITDSFCVVGVDSSIGTNNGHPIIGNTKPLAYSYDGYSSDLVNWTTSTSGNILFNDTQSVNTIISSNKKNYIKTFN